eukprot:GFYU01008015.1.p1 GENE.GFYU01008015.1~~GFYU01008015.1.p1  ORF type:complete len:341 (-),score=119.47 GFYU01008015.1:85-1107(-)
MAKNILATGGAGYIGSHCVVELLKAGYNVIIMDNLYNSSEKALERVKQITGKDVTFYKTDLLDVAGMDSIFTKHDIYGVIHFAGLKAVGESSQIPLKYYEVNVSGSVNLLNVMKKHNVTNIVFSSSATVYGFPESLPVTEKAPLSTTNPYGTTKLYIEQIMRDLAASEPNWNIILLRYFNPIGAHESGQIGEDPKGIPNNLVPFVTQVAVGRREKVAIFGDDYKTKDGTGVRDYIHVVDLVLGHVKAIQKIEAAPTGCVAVNLGTGNGYSVKEVIAAMSKASGKEIPYAVQPRRAGDVEELYADPKFAKDFLGWEAQFNMERMCADSWRWQSQNPNGYEG